MAHQFKYLITGCGHSGTGCVSKALTSVGIICTHEGVRGGRFDQAHGTGGASCADVIADSNHLAAHPGGLEFPFYEKSTIIHLVRHPLLVIRSWRELSGIHCDLQTALDQSSKMWVLHNAYVETVKGSARPYHLYPIESGHELLMKYVGKQGVTPRFWDKNYNKHWRGKVNISWKDFPDTENVRQLRSMATRYGYSLDNMEWLG